MRGKGLLVLALVASGCTSVRYVERDGCWVRQTEKFPKQVTEDLGPCKPATPKWAADRDTRLVQECMAQADYRWHSLAVEAWRRGQPFEAKTDAGLNECLKGAGMPLMSERDALVSERNGLKQQVGDILKEREALRAGLDTDRSHLFDLQTRTTDWLGEAAKKPAPSATATATSSGTSTSNSNTDSKSDLASSAPANVGASATPMVVPLPATPMNGTGQGGSGAPAQKPTVKLNKPASFDSKQNVMECEPTVPSTEVKAVPPMPLAPPPGVQPVQDVKPAAPTKPSQGT